MREIIGALIVITFGALAHYGYSVSMADGYFIAGYTGAAFPVLYGALAFALGGICGSSGE